jgi:hypothetical protein
MGAHRTGHKVRRRCLRKPHQRASGAVFGSHKVSMSWEACSRLFQLLPVSPQPLLVSSLQRPRSSDQRHATEAIELCSRDKLCRCCRWTKTGVSASAALQQFVSPVLYSLRPSSRSAMRRPQPLSAFNMVLSVLSPLGVPARGMPAGSGGRGQAPKGVSVRGNLGNAG